jgi:hypothetical protein
VAGVDLNDVTYEQTQTINCQECGAKPGERCETAGGNVKHEPHFMRRADFADGADPGPTPTRAERTARLMASGLREYLEVTLNAAVRDGIITAEQRQEILALDTLVNT